VAIVKVFDRADEVRVEIAGRFANSTVEEVASTWHATLSERAPRRFTVDISRLSGYDSAGRNLLSSMYHHGVRIAASTPLSLVFLNEVSSIPRQPHPAVVYSAPASGKPHHSEEKVTVFRRTRAAAAE
jgi:ABC-type transporter Mla MlaB component